MRLCRTCNRHKDSACFSFRKDTKKFNTECKSCVSDRSKKWNALHKERRKLILDKYTQQNREKVKASKAAYKKRNRRKLQDAENLRAKLNLKYRLTRVFRSRLIRALKGKQKPDKTLHLLGCTLEQFISFLEAKFQTGMTWDNYGLYGWHIDHIQHLAQFDLSKDEEVRKAFHYTNLQRLWATDNLRKGARSVVK